MSEPKYTIRTMTAADYEKVKILWDTIHGFGIRSLDDSEEFVLRFIRRNPTTSIVAVMDGEIVGSILCGHDGRCACFYHVCVKEEYRRHGIGSAMVRAAIVALRQEKISVITLRAFADNDTGNKFWAHGGWKLREDLNCYDFILNEENITRFNL